MAAAPRFVFGPCHAPGAARRCLRRSIRIRPLGCGAAQRRGRPADREPAQRRPDHRDVQSMPDPAIATNMVRVVAAAAVPCDGGGYSGRGRTDGRKGGDCGQGWQGRSEALSRAPRPAPPTEISAPRPAPPGRADRASPRSRVLGHPPDLFCPGPTRGQGWHARELRAGAAPRARDASRACAASAALARIRVPCLRAHGSRRRHAAVAVAARCMLYSLYS